MILKLLYIIGFTLLVPCETKKISIGWVDNLYGDYSFTENWDYATPLYKDEFGQLVCMGLCPPETDNMLDNKGMIFEDSVSVYYQLVDTAHVHYTIESETNSYEWIESNDILVEILSNDTVKAYTMCDVSTHSSLKLFIINDACLPYIELNSITPRGLQHFMCKGGYIKIDKNAWEKDTLKAEFDFVFEDNLWWRGRIFAPITQK